MISEHGVAVDPEKIKSVVEWSTPHNVRGVMGFLGLTRYYRKFVKGYGKIAKPLTNLTKKEVFKRGPEAAHAFEELKKLMATSSVLVLPNFTQLFEIECEASGRGIWVILMQRKKLTKSAY